MEKAVLHSAKFVELDHFLNPGHGIVQRNLPQSPMDVQAPDLAAVIHLYTARERFSVDAVPECPLSLVRLPVYVQTIVGSLNIAV